MLCLHRMSYSLSSHTQLRFMLVLAGSFCHSLGRDISDFDNNNNIYTTNHLHCQSIIDHAWQCWARIGNNPMCSDIIQQAWQCSGRIIQVHFQALDIETVYPQEQGSMQTITIGEDKKVIAVMIPEVFINHCLQFTWPLYRLSNLPETI